jgi:hypothetical protein
MARSRARKPDPLWNPEIRSAIGRHLAAGYDLTKPLPARLQALLDQIEQEMSRRNSEPSAASALRNGPARREFNSASDNSRAVGSKTAADARIGRDDYLASRKVVLLQN